MSWRQNKYVLERHQTFDAPPQDGVDQIPEVPGVYCILNRVSGHRYVGCAVEDMQARARSHRAGLRSGKPSNKLMRKHVAVYGVDAFFFFVLQAHPHSDEGLWKYQLEQHELWWTIQLAAHDERCGYNSEAGHIRTPAARFREAERRKLGTFGPYQLLPGVDLHDPIHHLLLKTWVQ
ncbi:GIY-YIG nuclease family protein [Rhodoferax sediminis]|uniref:GIY-YIG domain-containing protein n=1 Tax=Rhodoferax sediminis TaxID=2509614 RepID=A0A515D6F2_9BURK|nr:GIY-YIG nuclease family protein [Rhodoferax sediminis]QDL35958.1 hypothetical protein EUB48_00610 [Rhodoferax sediminis]